MTLVLRPDGSFGASKPVIWLPGDGTYAPMGVGLTHVNGEQPTTITWSTADQAVAIPFRVWESTTVIKLGWLNGSGVGGNTDVALYDNNWTRLVSTGSTACTGSNAQQWVDTADTTLSPGVQYYAALNHSSTTASQCYGHNSGYILGFQLLAGLKVQAVGATALPDPFVPADPAGVVNIPVILMLTRSGVA